MLLTQSQIPTALLLEYLDTVMSVSTNIVNTSLITGIYNLQDGHSKTTAKKATHDLNALKNCRSVSNLSFLSNVIEKVVLAQVYSNVNSHNHINAFQSAYRPGHSNETALLKVVNDTLPAMVSFQCLLF